MPNRTITIRGREHRSALEALRYLDAGNAGADCVILVADKYLSVRRSEADRLAEMGIEFAYLFRHRPTGQIMTVPVNG